MIVFYLLMGRSSYHIQNQLQDGGRKLVNLSKNLFWWRKVGSQRTAVSHKNKNVCEYVTMATVWLTKEALWD